MDIKIFGLPVKYYDSQSLTVDIQVTSATVLTSSMSLVLNALVSTLTSEVRALTLLKLAINLIGTTACETPETCVATTHTDGHSPYIIYEEVNYSCKRVKCFKRSLTSIFSLVNFRSEKTCPQIHVSKVEFHLRKATNAATTHQLETATQTLSHHTCSLNFLTTSFILFLFLLCVTTDGTSTVSFAAMFFLSMGMGSLAC